MNTESVTVGDITVTVGEATVRAGTRRSRLRTEAFQEQDADRRALLLEYADLVPVTLSIKGAPWPTPQNGGLCLTVERFADLPETLALKWERAVYALNPHWYTPASDDEKKGVTAIPSTGG
jgi:hypothetical protein